MILVEKNGKQFKGLELGRRVTGVGSSPTLPTKAVRTRLWKRLRKLDKELEELKNVPWSNNCKLDWVYGSNITKKQKLDQKRKEVRLKLKGYL